MKKILTMDEKNYSDELPEIFRIAVRGNLYRWQITDDRR